MQLPFNAVQMKITLCLTLQDGYVVSSPSLYLTQQRIFIAFYKVFCAYKMKINPHPFLTKKIIMRAVKKTFRA